MKVKPRTLKVSGLPSPRRARRSAAKRPNSIRRVLSGWSDSENSSPLSLELVGPLQPSLEQFLDHPGHARLFAGGEVAERDDAISAPSHRHLIFIRRRGILIPS